VQLKNFAFIRLMAFFTSSHGSVHNATGRPAENVTAEAKEMLGRQATFCAIAAE
jgi:hypothetical protein